MPLGAELRFLDRTKVLYEGRAYVFFGGTDYHRLASHPEVVRAFQEAARVEGLSCAGSRVTTGNHPLLVQLEERIAGFLGTADAALCAAGYLANTVAVESVNGDYQRFFVDTGVHASLATPAEGLPRDRVHTFRDADPEDLARSLKAHLKAGEKPLVLTDGVVSGDGFMPPLRDYWDLVRDQGGALLVDDSHGVGVVGAGGKGSPDQAGLPAEAYVQTGTLAKALGVFGGLVAGRPGLKDRVLVRSRAFVGATPIPPPAAAAALRSIAILREHPNLVTGLQARMLRIREQVAALGFPASASPAPILSITHRDEAKNQRLAAILLQSEIYPTFINYPGCPPGGHFRFTFSSAHADEEVERLIHCIASSC
jgi:glycine C-acetyltransferase/8-amino-7-oxononanoate synthase